MSPLSHMLVLLLEGIRGYVTVTPLVYAGVTKRLCHPSSMVVLEGIRGYVTPFVDAGVSSQKARLCTHFDSNRNTVLYVVL